MNLEAMRGCGSECIKGWEGKELYIKGERERGGEWASV